MRMDLMPLLFHEQGSRRVRDFSMGIEVVSSVGVISSPKGFQIEIAKKSWASKPA